MKYIDTRKTVSGEALNDLVSEARDQLNRAQERTQYRDEAMDRLLARTDNQPLDGVHHAKKGSEKKPKPFAGAADNRVRWADFATDCTLSLIMESLAAAELRVLPTGGPGVDARADALTRLARWCVARMGARWKDQLELTVRHTLTDSPGVGGAFVAWERRPVKGPRTVTFEALAQALLTAAPERTSEEVMTALETGTAVNDPVFFQGAMGFLGAGEKTVRAVLKALTEDETVEYMAVTDWDEGPTVTAMRYYDDFLLPDRCEDLAYASPWFRCAWVTEAQLLALAADNEWSDAFVKETLMHEGTELISFGGQGVSVDELRGLYQLIYAYEAETDDDGTVCRWQTVFSCADGRTACGRELLRGNKGAWPAVVFRRERQNRMLLDSRGIAEVSAPEQQTAKSLSDVAADNAILGGLPPVLARNVRGKVSVRSMAVVKLNGVNSELKYMQPPAYPAQANTEVQRLRDNVYEYLGLATKDGDPDLLGVRRRKLVKHWMDNLQELLGVVVSMAQAHASDALLAEVLGRPPDDTELRRDVTGNFRLRLEVNPEDLFARNVIEKTQALGQILGQMDRQHAVDTTPVALRITRVLFPDISEEMIRTPTELGAAELKDEEGNYLRIRAGLMPQMDTTGRWDYAARLGFWQRLIQENPSAIESMTPEAKANAEEWIKALQFQAEQYGANAELGRTGSEAVQAAE